MRGARARGGRSRAHLPGRTLHGTHDTVVRGAAAEMAVQRRLDVAVTRPGIAIEQGRGPPTYTAPVAATRIWRTPEIEERHGSAGALRTLGVWGPCRGPHVSWMPLMICSPRSA